ncbi:MAG TPA: competence protein ComEC, partial [Ramlibacter sp.]
QPQAALLASLPADHVLRTLRPGPRCEAGRQWSWDGVHFRVLHPPTEAWLAPSRPNTLSCVLHVSNGRSAALLPGDIEKAQEATLAADPDAVRADLLLVPHHGSKTSSSPALLAAVRPWVAVVQAGYRNRFGHPAAEVVERYRLLGIRLEASFGCGAASWRSERPAVVRCERTAAQRYWHHGAAAHPAPQGE